MPLCLTPAAPTRAPYSRSAADVDKLALRFEEIEASLCGNVENEYVEGLHVVGTERDQRADTFEMMASTFEYFETKGLRPPACLRKNKVHFLLAPGRPTYAQLFQYVNTGLPKGAIAVGRRRRNPTRSRLA